VAVPDGTIVSVMRQFFDGFALGAGFTGGINLFFEVIGDPAFSILAYNQDPGSRFEIMRRIGLNNGWDLRGRWGTPPHGEDVFVLTYYDPDRYRTTPNWVITADDYYSVGTLKVDRNTVRNAILGTANDASRTTFRQVDSNSFDLYGHKFMEMSEDQWSHIDTFAELQALVGYALADLKDPKATMAVELPYFWPIEINDVVRFQGNDVHHVSPLDLAVTGFTHTLSEDGDATTELRCRGTPAAANREWRFNPPKMQYVSESEPVGVARKGAIWLVKAPA
jgi:hypothetical protein